VPVRWNPIELLKFQAPDSKGLDAIILISAQQKGYRLRACTLELHAVASPSLKIIIAFLVG
jgi:hypothetical protein